MVLLFDIGGTYMRAAASEDGATLHFAHVLPTPASFKEGMLQLQRLAQDMCGRAVITAASVGIAGTLNREKSLLQSATNLKDWVKKPLKRTIQQIVSGVAHLQNDAALAGLGEACLGAGKGKRVVMYYTVSTGVGGARMVNGHIDEGSFEPGKQVVRPPCGREGCAYPLYLEDYISGRGLTMRYQKDPSHIHSQKVWDEVARTLAYGLNNSIVHWFPDVVVLGGGLINHRVISIAKVREYLKQTLRVFPSPPPIKKAYLGDEAGLYGALVYAKQQGSADKI